MRRKLRKSWAAVQRWAHCKFYYHWEPKRAHIYDDRYSHSLTVSMDEYIRGSDHIHMGCKCGKVFWAKGERPTRNTGKVAGWYE